MTVGDMEEFSRDPSGQVPKIPRSSADAVALRIGWAQTAEVCRRQEEIILLLSNPPTVVPAIDPGFRKTKGKKKGFFG